MQVDTTSTPGKRALLDLSILLDTLELAHPDIVEGWLARIRTALDNAVELLQPPNR
jgi:hypothetical protein